MTAEAQAKQQKVPVTLQIAIMFIPMLSIGVGVITPVINTIAQQFPEYPLSTIMLCQTMPNVFMIPMALITGLVAGKGVFQYRRLAIIGSAIYAIGGLIPFFVTSSFMTILICRGIYGIGSGMLYPLSQIIVYDYIPKRSDQSRILGNNTVCMNLGGIFFQYAAGMLATIQWNYCFACYFISLLTFFSAIFWLKKPNLEADENEEKEEEVAQLPFGEALKKVPAFVYVMIFFFFVSSCTSSPGTSLMSSYVGAKGLGDSGTTSLIIIFYQIGSICVGLMFGKVFKLLGRFSIPIGWAMMGIGFFFMYFGPAMPVWLGFCEFFRGIGFMIWFPGLQQEIGMFCPKEAANTCAGLQMCFMNIAMFVGGYYSTLVAGIFGSSDMFFIWVISGVIQCISAVIMLLLHLKDRPEFQAMKAGQD